MARNYPDGGYIRRWKREYAAMDAAGLDTSEAAGKLKQWQDEQEKFLDQTGLRRQYGREQVSGFGYAQASSAAAGIVQHVANTEKSGIIQKKAISRKVTERGDVVNPMNANEYRRMKGALRRQGVEVFPAIDGDDLRYMLAIGAEGTYSNGRITHIGSIPSRGTLFEEIIHLSQARELGELLSTDYVELYAREIEANRKLLKYVDEYRLDELDVQDITRNLADWESRFKNFVGASYDESNYRR